MRKKIYNAPEIDICRVAEPMCLVAASVGTTQTVNGTSTFVTDESFPIHDTGNPSQLNDDLNDHLSDDDWYKDPGNWGGD